MKKILIVLFVIMWLSSCDILSYAIDTTTYDMLNNVEFYDFADYDLTGIDSYRDIARWINARVQYKADTLEYFSSPEDTLRRGLGDCEDFSMLYINIAKIVLDIEMDLVILNIPVLRVIVEGGIGNHVDVHYNGVLYSAQLGIERFPTPILYIYTFDEVFGF